MEGHIIPKKDDQEWKFKTHRVTNLAYDMLCDHTGSDNKEKEGDNLTSNSLINIKILTTNIENVLVRWQFAKGKDIQIE